MLSKFMKDWYALVNFIQVMEKETHTSSVDSPVVIVQCPIFEGKVNSMKTHCCWVYRSEKV